MSLLFLACPKISFWSVLSLNCCRFFKIYTSYTISKYRSVKMINIPCFLVLLVISVWSWERLKKNYSGRPTEEKFVSPKLILSLTPLCSYLVSWKIYLLVSNLKKNCLYEQNMNNFSIPCKIRPVQEKIEIALICTFLILILDIYSNSIEISEILVWYLLKQPGNKIFWFKKKLLRLHPGKIPVVWINTFDNALMFTIC